MSYWMIATFALYVLGLGMVFATITVFEERPDAKQWAAILLWPIVAFAACFVAIAFAAHEYRRINE